MPPSYSTSQTPSLVSPAQPVDLRSCTDTTRSCRSGPIASCCVARIVVTRRPDGWFAGRRRDLAWRAGLVSRPPRARRLPSRPNEHCARASSARPCHDRGHPCRCYARHEPVSPDRLVEHARQLGNTHRVERQARGRGRGLLARLDSADERLEATYRALDLGADDTRLPSEDWLRDNFYVVGDQIRQVRTDLPPRYYLELPRLADGPHAGYPRVYALATELIAHTDNRVDADVLRAFVTAYQESQPLRIGEIWAIPIMLRLALVERLCALADQVLEARHDRARAQEVVAQLEQQAAAKRGRLWRWRSEIGVARAVHAAVCRRAAATPARSPAVDGAGVGAAGRTAGSPGRRRRDDPAGGADGSVPAGVDWQRHHRHADALGAGLADFRRARQPRRACPADRPGRRLRADGLCDTRSLPPVGRATGARLAILGNRGGGARLRPGAARPARPAERRAATPRRLLPDLARPLRAGIGPALPRAAARTGRPIRVPAPRPGLPRRHRRADGAGRGQPDESMRAATGRRSDAAARGAGRRLCRSASWPST